MNKRSAQISRKNILQAALEVFLEFGYNRANMRIIAEKAGISVGGIYLYFRNKETLYLTLMKDIMEKSSAEISNAINSAGDPVESMRMFISMRIDQAKRYKELIITQSREHGFTFGMKVKKKFFDEQRRLVEGIVETGIRSGVFMQCNTKEAAKVIVAVLRGYVVSLVVDTDNLFSSEECLDVVLKGLLARNGHV